MERHEFRTAFGEFAEDFNNSYSDRQVERIFQYVHSLHVAEFRSKLGNLADTSVRTPNVAQIKAVFTEAIARRALERRAFLLKNEPKCPYCLKTGIVDAVCANTGKVFAFRCGECQCAGIIRLGHDFLPWHSYDSRKFIPMAAIISKKALLSKTKAEPFNIDKLINDLCNRKMSVMEKSHC